MVDDYGLISSMQKATGLEGFVYSIPALYVAYLLGANLCEDNKFYMAYYFQF